MSRPHRIEIIEKTTQDGRLVFIIDGIHRFYRWGKPADLFTLRRDLMEIDEILKDDREQARSKGHKKSVTGEGDA